MCRHLWTCKVFNFVIISFPLLTSSILNPWVHMTSFPRVCFFHACAMWTCKIKICEAIPQNAQLNVRLNWRERIAVRCKHCNLHNSAKFKDSDISFGCLSVCKLHHPASNILWNIFRVLQNSWFNISECNALG